MDGEWNNDFRCLCRMPFWVASYRQESTPSNRVLDKRTQLKRTSFQIIAQRILTFSDLLLWTERNTAIGIFVLYRFEEKNERV